MAGAGAGAHGEDMTRERLWSSALCSLAPCLGLLAAIALAGGDVFDGNLADSLGVVAVPSMVAIVAGRLALTRLVVTVIMTAVAVFAGLQIGSSNSGLAGLAVMYVPMVGIPLAGGVWFCESVEAYNRLRKGEGS